MDIHKLLNQISAEENQLSTTRFLAPCVPGGQVQTRVAGMVYTFTPKPRNFEGWGIFQPMDEKTAAMIEEASLPQIAEYLRQFQPMRLWLAYALKGQTWLAYPVNESDVKQRLGFLKPLPVHLVTEGTQFEPILARWNGRSLWFEDIDRRADPMPSEELRSRLKKKLLPAEVRFKGMTPEMRTVYDLVTRQTPEFLAQIQQQRQEDKLRQALNMGGGELQQFRDHADHWLIEWTTGTGEHHTSAISKTDLTVISAGICLSGMDQNFDLQSLVGVVEQR